MICSELAILFEEAVTNGRKVDLAVTPIDVKAEGEERDHETTGPRDSWPGAACRACKDAVPEQNRRGPSAAFCHAIGRDLLEAVAARCDDLQLTVVY